MIIICIIILLSLTTNVFAERYAYSAGTNWGTTIVPSGSENEEYTGDFTTNVRNSWLHYSSISDVTASLSTSAFTKTYLNGTLSNGLKRLNSNILFFNGHGNSEGIFFSHQGDPRYATGIYIGNDIMYNGYFDSVGLNNINMNNVELVSFVGCFTGAENQNLVTKARERGAEVAVRI